MEITKQKRIPWNKGKKLPQLSGKNHGMYGKKHTDETRKKISNKVKGRKSPKYWSGKKHSEEYKKEMSLKMKGKNTWSKGRKFSEEHKQKLKGLFKGDKSPRWIEDRTKLQKYGQVNLDRRSYSYNAWKKSVFERDNYTCRFKNNECKGKIEAHHIYSFTQYEELRYLLTNGITLCHYHHPRVREEEKRLIPIFQELVSVSKESIC